MKRMKRAILTMTMLLSLALIAGITTSMPANNQIKKVSSQCMISRATTDPEFPIGRQSIRSISTDPEFPIG